MKEHVLDKANQMPLQDQPNTEKWFVERTDDNGVKYVMARNLNFTEACVLVKMMESIGHKQYWEAIKMSESKSSVDLDIAQNHQEIDEPMVLK